MEKKKNLIILGVVLGIFLLIGITYAFFTYYRESDKVNELIAGEVYLKFNDGNKVISLTNVFPETEDEARARTDNVVNFTINGKNTTTNKDVYYEIKLLYADDIQGKTRFLDEHLRFDLVETTGGVSETVLDAVSYDEINNTRIWVNTVLRNTTEEIERTYELRMWLSDDILISDTEIYASYTTDEFKNSYANVKVAVYGDFEYKELAQDASCFAYNVIENTYAAIAYNYPSVVLNTSEENVATCKSFMMSNGSDISDAQDGYQSFCEGTGTASGIMSYDNIYLKDFLFMAKAAMGDGDNFDSFVSQLAVVESYNEEAEFYEHNVSYESVAVCKDYMLNTVVGSDESDAQDGYQSFCEGTGIAFGDLDFQSGFSVDLFVPKDVDYFVENGVLVEPGLGLEIIDYDAAKCGWAVDIPHYINGMPVISIADVRSQSFVYVTGNNKFNANNNYATLNGKVNSAVIGTSNGVFAARNIASVEFPNTLRYIGENAFYGHNLDSLLVPESVIEIGSRAFAASWSKDLATVVIKGNPILGVYAFDYMDEIEPFQYGGTCAELNTYPRLFRANFEPDVIITSDTNSCAYTVNNNLPIS